MWLIAEYQPVTLFSFRSGIATSSGAKTLFLPTPFAIRMALLDAAIRTKGFEVGESAFNLIKTIPIAVQLPKRIVVTNLFTKVLKPTRKEDAKERMDRTISFREYAYFKGSFMLGLELSDEDIDTVSFLLMQINYFGKRGSFFQLIPPLKKEKSLSEDFILLDGAYIEDSKIKNEWQNSFKVGLIQIMDEWGEDLTFEKVNIYSEEKIELHKERLRKNIILPYRLMRSSKSFSYYERI